MRSKSQTIVWIAGLILSRIRRWIKFAKHLRPAIVSMDNA